MGKLIVLAALLACAPKPERPVVDAGTPRPFGPVAIDQTALLFRLSGPDFEGAREHSCSVEAVIDPPDGGSPPILRFRCTNYGAGF